MVLSLYTTNVYNYTKWFGALHMSPLKVIVLIECLTAILESTDITIEQLHV